MTIFDEAAERADIGTPTARKAGRNPRWPYVPVIAYTVHGAPRTRQLIGRAYATRDEAVEAAERHLETFRHNLARRLAKREYRALREQYGLPRELADALKIDTSQADTINNTPEVG